MINKFCNLYHAYETTLITRTIFYLKFKKHLNSVFWSNNITGNKIIQITTMRMNIYQKTIIGTNANQNTTGEH